MLSGEFENYRNLREVDSTLSYSLKQAYAGFWVHEIGDSTTPVRIIDHLELNKNGIIWQVTRYDIRFLNSDTLTMLHVRHCFLNPYSMSSDSDDVICDARIIRQSFIIGGDTCYGESQVDQMWRVKKIGAELELNKNRYTTYGGVLQQFFHDSAIDIVDMISIAACQRGSNLTLHAKKYLEDAFKQNAATILPDNRRLINDYYNVFLKHQLIGSLPVISNIPDSVALSLTIQPDGKVSKVLIPGQVVLQSKLEEYIVKEAFSWIFPVRQATEASEIYYTIKF
jgi:hypothetical protein